MAVRLRQISLSETGLVAADNTGCIVNDADSSFLMQSDGTNWNFFFPPAVQSTNSGNVPASSVSNNVIYDPSMGFLYSDGSTWSVVSRDPDYTVGLPGLAIPQNWPAPRLTAGTGGLTGTCTPTVGRLYFIPFTIPSAGFTQPAVSVSYSITAADTTAQVFATQATGTGPFTIPATPTLSLNGVSITLTAGSLTATNLEAAITAAGVPGLSLSLSGQQVVMTMGLYQSLVIAGGAPTLSALGLTAATTTYAGPGAALFGIYDCQTALSQVPGALFSVGLGTLPETSTGMQTYSFGIEDQFARGERVWLVYLRLWGSAELLCQTEATAPGDLGFSLAGGVNTRDVLTCTGTYTSFPSQMPDVTWSQFAASTAPQLFISFG